MRFFKRAKAARLRRKQWDESFKELQAEFASSISASCHESINSYFDQREDVLALDSLCTEISENRALITQDHLDRIESLVDGWSLSSDCAGIRSLLADGPGIRPLCSYEILLELAGHLREMNLATPGLDKFLRRPSFDRNDDALARAEDLLIGIRARRA